MLKKYILCLVAFVWMGTTPAYAVIKKTVHLSDLQLEKQDKLIAQQKETVEELKAIKALLEEHNMLMKKLLQIGATPTPSVPGVPQGHN